MSDIGSKTTYSGVSFGEGFWKDHARRLITEPKVAIVEIVANSWDAGADRIDIGWPDKHGGLISVRDNGVGMTANEFIERWRELNYDRLENQGNTVTSPPGNKISRRKAFGRNGKGRHSMFCFDFDYEVETWKNDEVNKFRVERGSGKEPFHLTHEESAQRSGHGTEIRGHFRLPDVFVTTKEITDLIGSRFVADPTFQIFINGEPIELATLEDFAEPSTIEIDGYGSVTVYLVDSQSAGRLSSYHGVAWWVNNRLVGEPSWRGVEVGKYLDARRSPAKRYTFVVDAELLSDCVRFDWTWFEDNEKTQKVIPAITEHITRMIQELFADVRSDRRKEAIRAKREKLDNLPRTSWAYISDFVDGIQVEYPMVTPKELAATVEVLAKLEKARTGYRLLEQLAQLSKDDLDALSSVLESWSIREAQAVLEELDRRLSLIERLEEVVESRSDELHKIHPLFEQGLWIFGPEYESVHYTSNQTLLSLLRDKFKDRLVEPLSPRRRPDLVVWLDGSVEMYSCDSFNQRSEVDGIDKVLLIELKRGQYKIDTEEVRQAEDYAKEIVRSGKIRKGATVTCFVLGTTLASELEDFGQKNIGDTKIFIYPRTYSTVLRMAHARTFHLREKIRKIKGEEIYDPELEQLIHEPRQAKLGFGR